MNKSLLSRQRREGTILGDQYQQGEAIESINTKLGFIGRAGRNKIVLDRLSKEELGHSKKARIGVQGSIFVLGKGQM